MTLYLSTNSKWLLNLAITFTFVQSGFYEQNARKRQHAGSLRSQEPSSEVGTTYEDSSLEAKNDQWKRILLLVIAITVSYYFFLYVIFVEKKSFFFLFLDHFARYRYYTQFATARKSLLEF